jgi:hypothetical protein
MGLVKAYKTDGRLPHNCPPERVSQIRKAAATMTHEQLDEYLVTKSAHLPGHVKPKR